VEEVEAKNSYCSSRRTAEVKEVELKNKFHSSKSTLKCDISTNHCLGAMAEEAVEMVGVWDNCSFRRTPSGKDAH